MRGPREELKQEDSNDVLSMNESQANLSLKGLVVPIPTLQLTIPNQTATWKCTNLFVNHPFKIYLICLTVYIAFIGASLWLDMIQVTSPHERDYLVWKDEKVLGYDYETLISESLNKASDGSEMSVRTISQNKWVTQIVYDCACDNIFTPENIQQMAFLESKVLQLPSWTKVCFATSANDPGCSSASYTSLASLFASPSTVTEEVLNGTLQVITTEPTYSKIKHLFGKEFSADN